MRARRVVVAAGIAPFAHRPPLFDTLRPGSCRTPSSTATCAPSTAGGSSSPAAARARSSRPRCCVRPAREREVRRPRARHLLAHAPLAAPDAGGVELLYASPDVGPAGVSRLVARPALWRRMPRERQDRLARRAIRPAGAAWLVPRLRDVPIRTGVEIAGAEASAGRVRLRLSDGSEVTADHLLLGTGYRVDVAQYAFLSRDLVARVAPRRRPPAPHARLREHPCPACTSSARPPPGATARSCASSPGRSSRPARSRATSWPGGAAEPWPSPTPLRARPRRAPRSAAPARCARPRRRLPRRSASCAASAAAASRSGSSATATTPSPPARGTRARRLDCRGRARDAQPRSCSGSRTRARTASPSPVGRRDGGLRRPPPRRAVGPVRRDVPPWATMRFAYDKRLTYPLAAALGARRAVDRRPARPRGPRRSRRPRDPLPGRPQAGGQGDVQPPDRGEGVARRRPRGAAAPLRRGRARSSRPRRSWSRS